MRTYLEFVADQRLGMLGMDPFYGSKNPFPFMDLQDVQELTNFFERRVSAYQMGVSGEVRLDAPFLDKTRNQSKGAKCSLFIFFSYGISASLHIMPAMVLK